MNFPPTNVKTFLHLALTLFHHFVIAYIPTSEFLSILQLATVFLVYSACSFMSLTIYLKDGSSVSNLSVYQLLLS